MSHARRHGSGGRAWGVLGLWIALGACGGVAGAEDAPAPVPAPAPAAGPTPLEPRSVPEAVADTVEFWADSLVSEDPVQREVARGRLQGASPERVRAVAVELARRLIPKGETVRRVTSNLAVSSEIRFVDLTGEAACGLPGFDPCAAQTSLRILDATEVAVWLERATHEKGIDVLTSSRITTYDGQRSTIQVLDKKAYISDFELEKTPNATIANPVVAQVVEGLAADLRATVSADKAHIALAMDLDLRHLVAPIAEDRLDVPGSATPLVVQRPEVRGLRWSRTVTLPVGGTALVLFPAANSLGASKAGHVYGLMVTCHVETLDVPPGTPIPDIDLKDAFKVGPPDLPAPGTPPPAAPRIAPAPTPDPKPVK